MTLQWLTEDSLEWLPRHTNQGSVITSLPDISELGMTDVDQYKKWIQRASALCFLSASPGHPVIFYQTDRKWQGGLISKPNLLVDTATVLHRKILWHKICLRREVGKVDIHRPTYSHLIAFGDDTCKPGKATPDVIQAGPMLYPNAMGGNAVRVALDAAVRSSNAVLDPFCGQGSVPIQAALDGMAATGIDIDPNMIRDAMKNTMSAAK